MLVNCIAKLLKFASAGVCLEMNIPRKKFIGKKNSILFQQGVWVSVYVWVSVCVLVNALRKNRPDNFSQHFIFLSFMSWMPSSQWTSTVTTSRIWKCQRWQRPNSKRKKKRFMKIAIINSYTKWTELNGMIWKHTVGLRNVSSTNLCRRPSSLAMCSSSFINNKNVG